MRLFLNKIDFFIEFLRIFPASAETQGNTVAFS